MRPITNQRMDPGIRDAIVRAGWCWAGEARRGDAFGLTTAAFDFVPRAYGWVGSRGSSRTSGLLAAGKTILIGILLTELQTLLANGCVGHNHAACCQQLFDITVAEGEAEIHPNGMTNYFSGEAIAAVRG